MESNAFIVRHSAPHVYDEAPEGTLCKVISMDAVLSEYAIVDNWSQKITWYKQVSKEANKPRWEQIN